jgi:hypothetical protein
MENTADRSLKSMARSLQEHIDLANALNLGFTAQLLSMAVMEIKINMHGISQQEVDALCDHIEEKSSFGVTRPIVPTPMLRSHERWLRIRRSRAL